MTLLLLFITITITIITNYKQYITESIGSGVICVL